MTGLPELGQRVRVWPYPGRRVQDGPAPVDAWGGGRFLPSKGRLVEWSTFHLEQLRSGAILLHPPACEKHDYDAAREECHHCGRTPAEAEKYDALFSRDSETDKE